jgi:hypothetical protein
MGEIGDIAGKVMHGVVDGAIAGGAHDRAVDDAVLASPNPEEYVEALSKLNRSRNRRTGFRVLAGAALLGVAAAAASHVVDGCESAVKGSVGTSITREDIGQTISRIGIDDAIPVATVEGTGQAVVTHSAHILGITIPASEQQAGAKVLAQDYETATIDPNTGKEKKEQVESGYDVYLQPDALTLSGQRDEHGRFQIVATINVDDFGAKLANPRPEAPADLNQNGNEPILWRVSYSGDSDSWELQAVTVAENQFETAAAQAAIAAVPAGIAEEVKKWTQREIGPLKAAGDTKGVTILEQASSPAEPVVLRFVTDRGAYEVLIDPTLGVSIPVVDALDPDERNILKQASIKTQVLATLAALQDAQKLEAEQGTLYVIDEPNAAKGTRHPAVAPSHGAA